MKGWFSKSCLQTDFLTILVPFKYTQGTFALKTALS